MCVCVDVNVVFTAKRGCVEAGHKHTFLGHYANVQWHPQWAATIDEIPQGSETVQILIEKSEQTKQVNIQDRKENCHFRIYKTTTKTRFKEMSALT